MVSSVWEDARVVASKLAQLLHSIGTSQHRILEAVSEDEDAKEEKEEYLGTKPAEIDNHSTRDLIEAKRFQKLLSKRWKHQVIPETDSDDTDMDHLPPLKLFDLLGKFHSFTVLGC